MSAHSVGTGRSTTGVVDVHHMPRQAHVVAPAVYMHSGLTDAHEATGWGGLPTIEKILSRIADAGYTIVAPTGIPLLYAQGTQSDDTTPMGRLKDAIDRARALGGTSAPVVLLGTSAGSTCALRYAALYPAEVACVCTWLTVPDLSTVRFQNVGGHAAGISTACGVANNGTTARGGTPLPAGSDPALAAMEAVLATIPAMLHHSSDDAYWTTGIGNAGAGTQCGDAFATAIGATAVNVGAYGHTDNSVAQTNIENVINFVRAHT